MQAVEPTAGRRLRVLGQLLRQHARARRHDVAARGVRRAGRAASTLPPADTRWLMMSDVCKHCTHAGCMEACPTGAIIRNEFDDVFIQPDICNGCGYCVPSCPFGVVDLIAPADYDAPRGFVSDGRTNDDATQHHGGVAGKCTLCYDRQKLGLDPGVRQGVPDRIDSIRQRRRAARARRTARRRTANARRRRLPLRRRRRHVGRRSQRVLFAHRPNRKRTTCRPGRCCRRRVSRPGTRRPR